MSATLPAIEWLQIVGLGALLGAIGQGARTVVGLKKVNDAASEANGSVRDMIETSRLLVSLAIGAIAGALAAISTVENVAGIGTQQIVALIGAGYAGADFVEGFMARARPGDGNTSGAAVPASATDGTVG